MTADADHLLAATLRLPRAERTAVVDQLLRSLDDEEDLLAEDREELHAAIARSEKQFESGEGVAIDVLFDRLSKR